jgi:putative addiction module CopG family antidote
MADRSFDVTEQHSRFIDAQVERGMHRSASEVVGEALQRYEADLVGDGDRAAVLRSIAAEGRACVERGEFTTVDDQEGSRALLARLNARAAEMAREPVDAGDRG